MPKCYLIAVCRQSSLDAVTNNYSLFGLVEQVQPPMFPFPIPFEVHVYMEFEPREFEVEHEVRVTILQNGERLTESTTFKIIPSKPRGRLRVKMAGKMQLVESGQYHISAEWRQKDQAEWTASEIAWPLDVKAAPVAPTPADEIS